MNYNSPAFYNKSRTGEGVVIKFEKDQELWEDLFLCLVKFITASKHLPFELDLVKETFIDLLEDVFLSDAEEVSSSYSEESDDEKKEDHSLESQQEVDKICTSLKKI